MNDLPSDKARTELPMLDLTPPVTGAGPTGRSRRAALVGGVVSGTLAVAALAALLGGRLQPAEATTAAAEPAQLAPAAAPKPSPSPSTDPDAGPVKVTGRALLGQLLDALPPGTRTSGYAAQTANVDPGVTETVAQVYVTTPKGTGMFRVFIGSASPDKVCNEQTACRVDERGNKISVRHPADNCIQASAIFVVRPDGTSVNINLADCLAWDGTGNKQGVLPMTEEEAIRLAGDPGIRRMITPAARDAAQARFPEVPVLTS
ncbi:hypothetical protein ACIRBX_37260 [Kitasatospora sp. NPDC096147]|uniref:hypothetical protein n=1 Tax=Kitasatospora sp. NPDC096147 TaxID=3364093 RepID=UPI003813733E